MDYYEQQLDSVDWTKAHVIFGSDGHVTKALSITPECARAIIGRLVDMLCQSASAAAPTTPALRPRGGGPVAVAPALRIGYDINGNQRLHVSRGGRSFSLQTLDTLPDTHRRGVTEGTLGELRAYLITYGTRRQKAIAGV